MNSTTKQRAANGLPGANPARDPVVGANAATIGSAARAAADNFKMNIATQLSQQRTFNAL